MLLKVVLAFCLFPCFFHEPGLSSLTQPWSKPSSETSSCWENGNDPRELHICVDDVHMTVASLLSLEVRVLDLVVALLALSVVPVTHQAVMES